MTLQISPNLRRCLALSILLALLFGGYSLVVEPLLASYAEDVAAIDQAELALVRYRRAARELPSLEQRLADLKQQGASRGGYLDGGNEDVVAAALQAQLKNVVQHAGSQLKSAQVLAGKDEPLGRRVTVRAQMVAPLAGVLQALHTLEAGTPILFVDNLEVRAIARPGQAPRDEQTLLDVRYDVHGFIRGAS